MAILSLVILSYTSEMEDLVSSDLISLTEVETWHTDALKDYCRRRGFKCSGNRRELCSKVYTLYNAKIQEIPDLREQEISKKQDYMTLFRIGCPAPDPNKLKSWLGEDDAMTKWPPISYFEIHKFITKLGRGRCRIGDYEKYSMQFPYLILKFLRFMTYIKAM